MNSKPRLHLRRTSMMCAGVVYGALFVAGCATRETTAPLTPATTNTAFNTGTRQGEVLACKQSGPTGAYTFRIAVQGGGDYQLPVGTEETVNFDGVTPVCALLYMPVINATWTAGLTAKVTISEINLPAGMEVVEIQIFDLDLGFLPSVFGTNSATVTAGPTSMIKVRFINGDVPPPPSGQGCTPGYWKQSQHFDSWVPTGLAPNQTIGSLFSNASLYELQHYSLVQGLGFGGGSGIANAARILLRAAIAAELNALHAEVGAPESAATIVASVNAALASGSRDTILVLAGQLDANNNLGCSVS